MTGQLEQLRRLFPNETIPDHPFDLGYWSYVAALPCPKDPKQAMGWQQACDDDGNAQFQRYRPTPKRPIFTTTKPTAPGYYLLKLPHETAPGYKAFTVRVEGIEGELVVFHGTTRICTVAASKPDAVWAVPPKPKPKPVPPPVEEPADPA